MKRYFIFLWILTSITLTTFSCTPNRRYINRNFSNLAGKENITAVVVGNPFYEPRWVSETSSDFNHYFKAKLSNVFDSSISIINTSGPEDTFHAFYRRIETDVLSYQPDIVFFMLGFIDSNQAEQTITYFREHVRTLFDSFHEADANVIVMTAIGNRDAYNPYDPGMERLKKYNEIILWEAGHHEFAVIDVGEYFERLRVSNFDEYYTLFLNELMLNQKGKEYVFDYVFDYIDKAYKEK